MTEFKEKVTSSVPSIGYLNNGEEDEMEVKGYERSGPKTLMTWTLILLSGGILRLVFHWWPHLMLKATHRTSHLRTCNKVLITEKYGRNEYQRYYVKQIKKMDLQGTLGQSDDQIPQGLRYFYCKKLRYIWNDLEESGGGFVKLQGLDHSTTTAKICSLQGLSAKEQGQRRELYGSNEIKVEITSILKLLLLEILNPFYVFQVASVLLWYIDFYYYYASAIVIMSVGGLTSSIYQTRQNEKRLRSTIQSTDIVQVSRGDGVFEIIPMEELVPGDVVVIPSNGCLVSCDAVLLTGNCIVNESMLTGESVPVTKTPLPNTSDVPFDPKEHARHTLFCGTKIVQTRYYGNEKVLALVIRTGFLTAKGNLVRSIMYPPPVDYKFEKDSYKFVGFLALMAALGFFASITWKIKYELPLNTIIIQSLDLITIVIPPALPAAMTAGRIYALKRLQQNRIFCISPRIPIRSRYILTYLDPKRVERGFGKGPELLRTYRFGKPSKTGNDWGDFYLEKRRCSDNHGDNIQTASSVAIDCGMIGPTDDVVVVDVQGDQGPASGSILTFSQLNKASNPGQGSQGTTNSDQVSVRIPTEPISHLAVTGKAFSVIRASHPELLERLLVRGTVFARMSPDQKQQLVEYLQTLGYFVGMCGDGANDCGALKAAHVGISLSDTEASVAAPFTYKDNNISCVSLLLREGRTALVTSFGIFKYMAIYSFTQFISVLILYTVTANISDFQFLYTDLFIISLFALFFGNTEPFPGELHKRPPPLSLVSIAPVASILLHMTLTFLFQVGAFLTVKGQPWFEPFVPDLEDKMEVESYENYAVFTISIFQYISMAIVFSQGRPYRKSIFSNFRLISSIIIMTFFTIYLVIKPCSFLDDLFLMRIPPSWKFQVGLLAAAGVNFVIAYAIEEGVVNGWLGKYRGDCSGCSCSSTSENSKGELEYERIERTLKGDLDKGINKAFVTDDLDLGHCREKGPF